MTLAGLCVAALVAVVVVSCATEANVGLLALALAWVIGVYVGPSHGLGMSAREVAGLFPTDLFITLLGVTMLFSVARANGTLRLVTAAAERLCGSTPGLLGVMFFLLAAIVSAAGAGNVPTAAVLAPPAMLAASRAGVSPMAMMVMVGHGAIGGGLSPVTPMGVVADEKLADMGLAGHAGYTFWMNLLVNAVVAAGGYVVFRGWRSQPGVGASSARALHGIDEVGATWRQWLSLGCVATVIAAVVAWNVHVGFSALAVATLLILAGCGSERDVLRDLPWGVILMVCGMSVLVGLCEKTGAITVISSWIAACASPATLPGWLAGLTGLISVFSSTSGVVLPTFLPTVPEVIRQTGQEPSAAAMLAAATAINVGSNVVDVSSVSTIGALCVAACPDEAIRRRLWRQGLCWGLAMTFVAAAVCQAIL
ncbi:MAG: SLC13 family permease [Planctomycetaceae bacterium]